MMDANELAEKVGKLLLRGEYVDGLEIRDDLERAEIELGIRFFEPSASDPREDRLIVQAMHVEDAAARLLAYLARRADE